MKTTFKYIFCLFISCLLPAAIMAQTSTNQASSSNTTHYGLKGGVNFSSAYGSVSNTDLNMRAHAGLFLERSLSPEYSVHLGMGFSGLGVNCPGAYTNYRLNYIQAPLMFVFNSGKLKRQWNFMAGPYISYFLNAKSISGLEEEDISKYFKNHDAGLSIGVNTTTLGKSVLGCQYNLGLTDILAQDNFEGAENYYNQFFQVYFGFYLK